MFDAQQGHRRGPHRHARPPPRRRRAHGHGARLHVYVQKPLTYTIEESRKLAALAAANPKLVTQMGNQGHSGDDGRRVIELIRGGVIGPVHEVHVWTNRPVWPQGMAKPAAAPTPASLDWATWLGPANVDWGYNADYAHFNWRGWVPFGSRRAGRHGRPPDRLPVLGAGPGPADQGGDAPLPLGRQHEPLGHQAPAGDHQLSAGQHRPLRVRPAPKGGPLSHDLVRRRPPAADPAGLPGHHEHERRRRRAVRGLPRHADARDLWREAGADRRGPGRQGRQDPAAPCRASPAA